MDVVIAIADCDSTVPSNLFLNKVGKPAIYLPCAMMVWGVISGATAIVQSYGGLVAIRFLLGFVEAAYFVRLSFYIPSFRLENYGATTNRAF
jgi:hypothetical protein